MVLKFDPSSRQSSRRGESSRRRKDREMAAEERRIARSLGIQPDELTEATYYHTEALLAIEKAYGIDSTAGTARSAAREAVFAVLSGYYSDGHESGLADGALGMGQTR